MTLTPLFLWDNPVFFGFVVIPESHPRQTRGRFSCLSPFLNLHFIDPVNGEAGVTKGTSDCVKNVILSEAKDLKWPENEILRYTQNDKKREKCFFTQSDIPRLSANCECIFKKDSPLFATFQATEYEEIVKNLFVTLFPFLQ